MPGLQDITYSDVEDDVGAETDFNNLETSITVSPIPTSRVHKDHHVTQIIGDLSSTTQTRSMTKVVKDQDLSWIKAMQEELLQFKIQKVWILVGLSYGKRAIGTKWVFRNKKDERGVVVRNKERLVVQGHTQGEEIDYEEVFAPVARIEAIRLFLAYASFMGFMVYQMDVKSTFLYGTIEEEVYVCQPPGFKDPDHPDKVYKVVNVLYGLHQSPRAWYNTLANYLLENGFQRGKLDQTLFIKRQKGDILLVQIYVDAIIFGATNKDLCKSFEKLMKDKFHMSLMGELTFFLGLQVKQKKDGIFISQDKYIAKILRKFGLKKGKSASTPIDTEKPLLKDPDGKDVDVHTYRSMIGSLMYLTSTKPDIMFACKKQTVVATSSTEAEYVAAASCCVQVLWIQNQLLDYRFKEAKVDESAQDQGRQAESQAEIYKIDMDHANKVLSIQEDETEPAEVQEVVDVVTTTKLIIEVVTAASETITAASSTIKFSKSLTASAIITTVEAQVPAATTTTLTAAPARVAAAPSRRRKGVDEAIDHVERKAKEDPAVKRYQVLKRKPQTEVQARKNMMMYLKNVAGFKMDSFKGMSYDDIRLIFEAKFNSNVAFLLKIKEQIKEDENRALQKINETPAVRASKRRKEDLEALWSLVKERFSTTKPKNFSVDFLLVTLGAMFEKPDIHSQIWKIQRTVHGPAKVKGWKLLESCGVQIITFTSTQLILLVERKFRKNSKVTQGFILVVLDLIQGMTNYRYWLQITSSSWSFVSGTSLTQWTISSISTVPNWSSSIGSESFWPSILLLTKIIRAIVTDVLVVVASLRFRSSNFPSILHGDLPIKTSMSFLLFGISLIELSTFAIVAVCVSRAAAILSTTSFLMEA
nr:putative ribonuclease H-like domain-containing protein [Tanacetum cinerariifolium]